MTSPGILYIVDEYRYMHVVSLKRRPHQPGSHMRRVNHDVNETISDIKVESLTTSAPCALALHSGVAVEERTTGGIKRQVVLVFVAQRGGVGAGARPGGGAWPSLHLHDTAVFLASLQTPPSPKLDHNTFPETTFALETFTEGQVYFNQQEKQQ